MVFGCVWAWPVCIFNSALFGMYLAFVISNFLLYFSVVLLCVPFDTGLLAGFI